MDIRATSFLLVLQVTPKHAPKKPFRTSKSDIFDGFKALGSLQCLSIIKHLPPRQQEIWRCARENLLVPSGLYRDKGRFLPPQSGYFCCQASHAKPFHEMPDVLSSSRVCSSKWWFGEEAPGIFGPTCWRNRQTLAWSMVKSHNSKHFQERPWMRSLSALVVA